MNKRIWLGSFWLLAAFFAFRSISSHLEVAAGPHPSAASCQSKPIETIGVGQRVVTTAEDTNATKPSAVDPRTWRHLWIEADNRWPDGTPDVLYVETLQPPSWIEANHAHIGAMVHLPVDLTEMGVPATVRGRVVANEPCPEVEAGPGRVVLSTINHLNNDVWEVAVAGQNDQTESIHATGFHKFYSATRQSWVSAHDLRPSEELRGISGPVTVQSVTRLPGVQRVYDMTIEDEHVYRVSSIGVLVHNDGCLDLDLTDARGRQHILDGEPNGGGGHGSGRGIPDKSEFPWSDQRILNEASDIATDPNQSWSAPDGRGYISTDKTIDGVDVRVIYDTVNVRRICQGIPSCDDKSRNRSSSFASAW